MASIAIPTAPSGVARDSSWVIPASSFVLLQYIAAAAISAVVRPPELPPTGSYMLAAAVLSAGAGLILILRRLWQLWRQGEERPIERFLNETDWSAVFVYAVGFQLVALQIGALTWLKQMLPYAVPFWADPLLASVDRALFGVDAWKAVPVVLVRPLDVLYPFWAPVKFLVLILMLSLPASQLKARSLLSYFLTVGLLGVLGQYLLSSAGPVFYADVVGKADFAGLQDRIASHAPLVAATSRYLWSDYVNHSSMIGSGISAMPSMHVATTTWTALTVCAVWPRLRHGAWLWWAIIFLGSIALGWHYFIDSACAALGALLCWHMAPVLLSFETANLGRIARIRNKLSERKRRM